VIRTFPLFAAAYVAGRRGPGHSKVHKGPTHTHACEVDAQGFPTRVLCKRVQLESICADTTQATDEAPTCPQCAAKKAKAA